MSTETDSVPRRGQQLSGILVMVTASDEGWLQRTCVGEGERVELGGSLAILTTEQVDAAKAFTPSGGARLPFRAVAELSSAAGAKIRPGAKRGMRKRAVGLYRSALGSNTRLDRMVREQRTQKRLHRQTTAAVSTLADRRLTRRDTSIVVESGVEGPRQGIFLYGGCDLQAMLAIPDDVVADIEGTLAVVESTLRISGTRSDVLLQTLEGIPDDVLAETREHLTLHPDYFRPVVFEPTFEVPGSDHLPFKKVLTVLSSGSDVVRPVYRHREHGFLIDPGGMWLEGQMLDVPAQKAVRAYMTKHFESIGRVTVDEYKENYRRLIPEIKRRTGGEVAVFNTLTVEPGDRTHNYQLRKAPEGQRRRRFVLALTELSDELDFYVIDVDRALKREGVQGQVDFAHFPKEKFATVAAEGYDALRQMGTL